MDKETKKEIVSEYKQKKTTGGVYKITNTINGRYFIKAEIDLQSLQNRFEFNKKIGSCFNPKMKADFEEYGVDAFELEFLEELEKKNEESPKNFRDKLKKLEENWIEKLGLEKMY
ncbi:GIY-YIG nuclease family protein [Anaerovorax odorimutans]|uniref:GIY-YIG nuclease family protein n=1 Tax=Anaerovorax odorimutans TaxID=109327 RepID=UPI00041CC3D7|nr:GIY-YIG nuclease family protein [Anaerovorax odorimutans]